jgi:outer membrane protein TolC
MGGQIGPMWRTVYLLACSALAAWPAAVAQVPLRLSLEDALNRAAEHHPGVEAARWEHEAREADALGASAAFLPTLSTGFGAMRTEDPVAVFGAKLRQGRFTQADFALAELNFPSPINDVSTSLTLEQPIVQLEGLFNRKAAQAGARASRLGEVRATQAAAFEVIRAYFAARLGEERVQVLEESYAAANQTVRQVARLRAEGAVTVVDAQLARSQASELEAALAGSRAAQLAATDLLLELVGAEPGQPIELTDSLTLPADIPGDSTVRPDIAALQAGLEAGEASVQRAKSQWLPSLAAFGDLSWHDPDFGLAGGPSHWTLGLLVRWTPFRGMSDVGQLRRARAELEATRAELVAAERRAKSEVRAAAGEWQAALAGYRAAEAALGQGTLAARAASSRYDEGAATIGELLAVRAAESAQRVARLQALYQARVAQAALVLALGGSPR